MDAYLLGGQSMPWYTVCLSVMATQASAMSIRELRAIEQLQSNGDIHAQYYLIGVMEGALEANAMAQRQGRKPLFCLRRSASAPSWGSCPPQSPPPSVAPSGSSS